MEAGQAVRALLPLGAPQVIAIILAVLILAALWLCWLLYQAYRG